MRLRPLVIALGPLTVCGCAMLLGAEFENLHGASDGSPNSANDATFDDAEVSSARDGSGPIPIGPDGTCPAGRKACGAQCVSLVDPAFGCANAASCEGCAVGPDAIGTCKAGSCSFQCKAGFVNETATGCVIDVEEPGRIAVGSGHSCRVKPDKTIGCWGQMPSGRPAPAGPFDRITAGYEHTCALSAGTITCWGFTGLGTSNAPSGGPFTRVISGTSNTCAVTTTGPVACSGREDYVAAITPPAGAYSAVSVGYYWSCSIRNDGMVICAGDGQNVLPAGFRQISAGTFACGLRASGAIECWAPDRKPFVPPTPPQGSFRQISVGYRYACAVRTDGPVVCWGENAQGQATALPGTFRQVSTGLTHTCAIRTDGSPACWGNNNVGQAPATPP